MCIGPAKHRMCARLVYGYSPVTSTRAARISVSSRSVVKADVTASRICTYIDNIIPYLWHIQNVVDSPKNTVLFRLMRWRRADSAVAALGAPTAPAPLTCLFWNWWNTLCSYRTNQRITHTACCSLKQHIRMTSPSPLGWRSEPLSSWWCWGQNNPRLSWTQEN